MPCWIVKLGEVIFRKPKKLMIIYFKLFIIFGNLQEAETWKNLLQKIYTSSFGNSQMALSCVNNNIFFMNHEVFFSDECTFNQQSAISLQFFNHILTNNVFLKFKHGSSNTFKYHVFASMERFQLELIYLFFSTVFPSNSCCFCPVGLSLL